MRDEAVIDIATFLARCWSSDRGASVVVGQGRGRRIGITPLSSLSGDALSRYRQMRANLWHAAMRRRFCEREYSADHAYGFVLGALEARRVEGLGLAEWRGMGGEIVFNYAYQWLYRPLLNSVHGRPRMAEAFLQSLLFGDIKGDVSEGELARVRRATGLAEKALAGAQRRGSGALEEAVPAILDALELDALASVPVAFPWSRPDAPRDEDELRRAMKRISSRLRGAISPARDAAEADDDVRGEWAQVRARGAEAGASVADGVEVPDSAGADESAIYDHALIARLKVRFRDWRTSWSEVHARSGDEIDADAYIESPSSRGVFLRDEKRESSADVMMLLDHSSSIASAALEYKKAALALCEVLARLKARFSVYAFSTSARSVVCWEVKRAQQRWGSACAKRLAAIAANGSTPLARVYSTMRPILESERPETFLTMTDGEPSDAAGVRAEVMAARAAGVRMAALGLGADVAGAAAIAGNLRGLGYERIMAVSRLEDIPRKVLGVLGE